MPSVGAINYITLGGELPKAGLSVRDISRPGVHGLAVKDIGNRGALRHVVGTVDTSAAALVALINAIEAQRGQVVTLVDEFGNSRANVVVMGARARDPQKQSLIVGGLTGGDVLVVVDYELIDANVGIV